MNTQATHCGYVAIIGRPNVGKSTLLNALIGQKVSIISAKPQTTRQQILGIYTEANTQVVFIDTPGVHSDIKRSMNRYMNRVATSMLEDADVILFVIDSQRWTSDDDLVLKKLQGIKAPVILVINKIDKLKDKKNVLPLIEKMHTHYHFTEIVPISAQKQANLLELKKTINKFIPEGPFLFSTEQVTDKSERFQIAEIIREKLIRATQQELPYSTTVIIEDIAKKENVLDINAIIWVERESQKAIVIGKGGELLKKVGSEARKDIVKLLKHKIFLRLWVKVKNNWTDDEQALGSLGYE